MNIAIPFHFIILPSGSIGHLVMDTEKILYALAKIYAMDKRFLPLFISGKEPSSHYFVRRLKEEYFFVPNIFHFLHRILRRCSPSYAKRDAEINAKSHSLLSGIHDLKPLFMCDTHAGDLWSFLKSFMREGNFVGFVCLVVRDSGFDIHSNRDQSDIFQQQIRHTPIDYFIPIVNYLIRMNLMVIRVGRHNITRMSSPPNGYFEFSDISESLPDSTEFELFENCDFVISTGSGPDNIGLFYRKLVLYLNVIPISAVPQTFLCPMLLMPIFYDGSTLARIENEVILSKPLIDCGPALLREMNVYICPQSPTKMLEVVTSFVTKFGPNFKPVRFVEQDRVY